MTKEETKQYYSDKNIQWFISNQFSTDIEDKKYVDFHSMRFNIANNDLYDFDNYFKPGNLLSALKVISKYNYDNYSGAKNEECIGNEDKGLVIDFSWYNKFISSGKFCRDSEMRYGFYILSLYVYLHVAIDYLEVKDVCELWKYLKSLINGYSAYLLDHSLAQLRQTKFYQTEKDNFKEIFIITQGILGRSEIYLVSFKSRKDKWEIIHNTVTWTDQSNSIYITDPKTGGKSFLYYYGRGNMFFNYQDLIKFQKMNYKSRVKDKIEEIDRTKQELSRLQLKLEKLEQEAEWFDIQERIRIGISDDIDPLKDDD